MKRISAKVREDAADFCSAAQCSIGGLNYHEWTDSRSAIDLACRAFDAAYHRDNCGHGGVSAYWAEAEAWIRSGWSPGDTWTDEDRVRAGLEVTK